MNLREDEELVSDGEEVDVADAEEQEERHQGHLRVH